MRRLAVALLTTSAACGGNDRIVLEVRTSLPRELRAEVETSFEAARPDVDVRFTEGEAGATLADLGSEGPAPFDVWWGAPALVLEDAADAERLLPYRPGWVGADVAGASVRELSASGRPDTGGQRGEDEPADTGDAARWHPLLRTPFVIAFDRTVVPITEAPTDWIDLFHFAWYDDVRLLDPGRTAEGAYFAGAMIVQALREDGELDRGFEWLDRLDEQVDAYAGDPDELVRALRLEDVLLAILPRAAAESARADGAPWLHYRLPESGTPVLVLGVGIVAGTRVGEAARAFVEHLGTVEVVTASTLLTHWEPAHGEADTARLPPDFELDQAWTPYPPAIDTLAAELDGWIERWELETR